MSGQAPGSGVRVAQSPQDLLADAAARVAARLEEIYPPLAPGGSERAGAYLGTLRTRIDQILAGADPEPHRKWLERSPLSAPLMEALALELIDGAGPDPESAIAVIAVLRAWASLRGSPSFPAEATADDSADLKARMRGPGAFDLLVEVAHDFRSPLTSILFLAEALRDGHSGPVSDVQRSQLGLIYSAAFGLAGVASDVMDLARKESDLVADDVEPFAVAEVFRSVERMVRPLVEEKGLELRIVVPDRWQGRGHRHALSRVLLNLTTNAIKFTDEGGVEIGVQPLAHGRLEYYVKDTGRGISPGQRETLFQPFKRRSGSKNEGYYFSGSGIGLSIAQRLLRAMRSELRLDSSDERGTRFSFVLEPPARI